MSSTHSASNDFACAPSNDQEPVYALVKRAEMNPADVEDAGSPAVEVTVLWERSILHVTHLGAADAFTLSSEGRLDDAGRFVVDRAALGRDEAPVVLRDNAEARFVVLPGARGEVEIDGVKRDLDALVAAGIARPSSAVPGAHEVNVVPGGRYRMELGNLTIQARVVAAGRRVAGASRKDPTLRAAWAASAAAAAVVLGVMRLASQEAALLTSDDHDARLAELRAFVSRQQEQALTQPDAQEAAAVSAPAGAAHQGAAGSMGDRRSEARNRRYEIRATGERPHLAREVSAREAVTSRGIFASLGAAMRTGTATSGVVSPFGEMTEAGAGDRNANGNINGGEVGDAWGGGGLDTLGTGFGGGGHENGIGTGPLGTLGHGNCPPGEDCRYGRTQGTRLAARGTHGPIARAQAPTVDGQIPQEAIRRVVVRNIGQVNRCYEQGLNLSPTAAGRVTVRFVIAGGGAVLAAGVAQNELGVASVGDCIANAVRRWQFPVPEASGPVTVSYPFMLQPADP
ncbi:MAG: AgmX/PglI C-terminal domain-containing protein [Polyangiales bacterium]